MAGITSIYGDEHIPLNERGKGDWERVTYENLANATNNVYAFADYKEDLLKYLN